MDKLESFQKNLGIVFKNKDLLRQVFVHRSYLNENPHFDLDHNERLEFLGDAVLELIVTEHLYKNYKEAEGILTAWRSALVKGEKLAELAKKFEIGENLMLSRGEDRSGGRTNQLLLANAFEALVGAMYLDQGYETCRDFIEKNLLSHLEEIIEKKLHVDPKSNLQEKSQEEVGITPTYEVLDEVGPDHAKTFEVGVYLNSTQLGKGKGSSKQSAQTAAAKDALAKWNKEKITDKFKNKH